MCSGFGKADGQAEVFKDLAPGSKGKAGSNRRREGYNLASVSPARSNTNNLRVFEVGVRGRDFLQKALPPDSIIPQAPRNPSTHSG